jgi:periplasmic mercuric ion binding protein
MKRRPIFSAALLGLALAGMVSTGPVAPSFLGVTSAQAATDQQQIFTIENMTCALCPLTVKTAMEGVVGVKSVSIDFEAKTATVIFDPAATIVDAIATSSTNAGYPAKFASVQ